MPRREPREPVGLPDVARAEYRTVETPDATRLALARLGDPAAPLVVAVHGWTADRQVWGGLVRRLLARHRQVAVYDQRGHGASTLGRAGTTIEALGDDLAAVLDALDAREAVVVGHSMGGMAALALAVDRPATRSRRVGGLVLVATEATSALDGIVPGWIGKRLGDLPAGVAARLAAAAPVDWIVGNRYVGPAVARATFGRRAQPAALEATRHGWARTPAAVRAGFVPPMSRLDLTSRLAGIRTPTVVVCGDRDTVAVPRHSEEMARLIPGARLEVLPGVGHQVPFEAPERLAELVAELVDGLRAGPSLAACESPSSPTPTCGPTARPGPGDCPSRRGRSSGPAT